MTLLPGHLEALERLLEAAGDEAAAAGDQDPEDARAALRAALDAREVGRCRFTPG